MCIRARDVGASGGVERFIASVGVVVRAAGLARSVGAASSSSCSTIEVGTLARLVDWFADVIAPPICLDDEEEEEEDEKKKKTRVKARDGGARVRRRPQSRAEASTAAPRVSRLDSRTSGQNVEPCA